MIQWEAFPKELKFLFLWEVSQRFKNWKSPGMRTRDLLPHNLTPYPFTTATTYKGVGLGLLLMRVLFLPTWPHELIMQENYSWVQHYFFQRKFVNGIRNEHSWIFLIGKVAHGFRHDHLGSFPIRKVTRRFRNGPSCYFSIWTVPYEK
jgi:hypothetical protein